METLGNKNSEHLYEVGTEAGRIDIHANTRSQARVIAERAGFKVRDINMIG